jgi:hypothetical protein
LLRSHVRNSGMSVSEAERAWRAAAKSSMESYTWSAACAAIKSSSVRWGSHDPGVGPVAECRSRGGVPWDEAQGTQPKGARGGASRGRKALGGSHSSAVGRSGGGGGGFARPPCSSGAVEVAPDALGPARAGPASSGGFGGRQREVTPAADRSRPPPPAGRGGGGSRRSPGPPRQFRRLGPSLPEPGTRLVRSAAEASCPWCLHSQ